MGSALHVPRAPDKIVDDGNIMALLRQIHGLRPAKIAITTYDENIH
jgi:hypothetical protein